MQLASAAEQIKANKKTELNSIQNEQMIIIVNFTYASYGLKYKGKSTSWVKQVRVSAELLLSQV